MRALKLILLIFCFLCLSPLYGQEEAPPPAVPDPIELKPEWWLYFDKAEDSFPEKSDQFLDKMRVTTEGLTPENQKAAGELIDKIQTKLQSYYKIATTPIPRDAPPTPIADVYTINQLIAVHNEELRLNLEQRANRVQQDNLNQEINSTTQYLSTLRSRYSAAEARSEQKFLLGLEIILYNITLKVAQKNLAVVKATNAVDIKRLRQLNEELNAAKKRLVSTPEEQRRLELTVQRTQAVWDEARQKLQEQEAESARSVTAALSREEEIRGQLASTILRKAAIEEAIAHNAFIFANLKLNLSRIVNDPNLVDPGELDANIDSWEHRLLQLQRRNQDWSKRTEQLLQQYGQILSISGQDVGDLETTIRQIVEVAQASLLLTQQLSSELNDSFFIARVLDERVAGIVSTFKLTMWRAGEIAGTIVYTFSDWLNQSLFEFSPDRHVTFANIVKFILVLLLTVWVSRLARRGLRKVAQNRKGVRKSVIYRVSRLFQYVIFAIGLLIAFASLGFDFGNFVIVLGALGVGLGFGLQSIFNNFISGIIILFESQLKVGDYVELEEEGLRGEIREINVRNTLIVTNDGTDVLIPNSQIVSNRIINWTLREPYRRVHVPFSVAYGTSKELVKQLVLDAAKSVPNTLIRPGVPEPRVYLSKFGDNALEFELVVWVDEPSTRRQRNTRSAYLWAIDTTFKEHGIEIPFPQRDIHVKD